MASYKKIETGWQFRISYKDKDNKYKTKSGNGYKTKKEAQIAASKFEEQLNKGIDINGRKTTFIPYFKKWYSLYKEPFISHKTKLNYELSIKIAENFFKQMTFEEITADVYQEFINAYAYNEKTQKPRSKESVAKVNIHLKACFKRAVQSGIIYLDPTDGVVVGGYIKAKKDMTNYLSEKEQLALIAEITKSITPKNASLNMVLFMLSTGARFSEAAGLTWNKVDFDANTVTIDQTWDYVVTNDFAPTKNEASNRTITIDDFSLRYLKNMLDRQDRLDCHYKDLVFSSLGEEPPSNNSVNKSLVRALKRANINRTMTCHGLRHTHVSFLLHKGINIKYISRRVGHSNVSTTLDKYSHIIDEMEQIESNKVNTLLQQAYPDITECKINAK